MSLSGITHDFPDAEVDLLAERCEILREDREKAEAETRVHPAVQAPADQPAIAAVSYQPSGKLILALVVAMAAAVGVLVSITYIAAGCLVRAFFSGAP